MVSTIFTALLAATGAMAVAIPQSSEELGCVQPSNNFQGWTVSDFDYHWTQEFTTPAHSNSYGYVNFNLTGKGLDSVLECHAMSTVYPDFFRGDQWYSCYGTIVSSAQFKYDATSGELTVNNAWLCDTTNHNFTGTATPALSCKDSGVTKNENWEIGQQYSYEEYNCDKTTFDITNPTQV